MIEKPLQILFFDMYQDHFGAWLSGLAAYLTMKGHRYDVSFSSGYPDDNSLMRYDLVFVWNGNYPSTRYVKDFCAIRGIPSYVVEVGWFPQRDYFFIDPIGINGKSSIMNDDFSWITNDHIRRYRDFREEYLNGRQVSGFNLYVLCPLQVQEDTNIVEHSPIKTMQGFINYVEEKYPDDNIIFKRHPLDNREYTTNKTIVTDGNFLDLAVDAKLVFGINSTCLLEAAMLGVETHGIGLNYLTNRENCNERLLAALVDKQIPVNDVYLDYWLVDLLQKAIENRNAKHLITKR